MNRKQYTHLLGERNAVQKILATIPEEDIIDRNSFLGRLDEINELINVVGSMPPEPVRTRLTYKGRPVIESYGISARFGMAATEAYATVVTRVAAGLDRYRPLSPTGPIPNKTQNQLIITGTALGSFGFEIEEHVPDQLAFPKESSTAVALLKTQELLQGTLGTDDELTEVIAGSDPTSITALRGFLRILTTNDAVCALETEGKKFQFNDAVMVRRSYERLSQSNLHRDFKDFTGYFSGVLPKQRTFEFTLSENSETITGKLGTGVTNPGSIKDNLDTPITIRVTSTWVGNGRPRYVLNDNPEWPDKT